MKTSDIKRVGVVGAGTMGNGIAHVFALAGAEVRLVDVDRDILDRARSTIEKNLARQLAKDRIRPEEARGTLERIETDTELEPLADVDAVVEAIVEDRGKKGDLLRRLGEICSEETLLASNTSSISITDLAAEIPRPERFVGMHFMNPVPVMSLVEVIRGLQTSDETAGIALELCRRLGKTPVEVRDFPGFVSNRVLMPMINEAIFCLYEGVAGAEEVDTVLKLGMNHPMGPLQLADFIGLDTCLAVCEVLHRELGDDKYRPCPLLRNYVAAGWLGRKSGRGFYRYDDGPA